ncbi:hypothetical protein T484DRAFT_1891242 [Baffinella frigidus]|nr:hypothetical protein T484DRAFT_1891242 [Cryptophyta sp. CCMP2293]
MKPRETRKGGGSTETPGMDRSGAWKSWVAKDAIKPVNMAGCRPPLHAFDFKRDKPTSTVTIGGKNAPYILNTTYQRFDVRENPSDRTKIPAAILEAAESGVRHDPLAAYHPPSGTTLPTRRPQQEPDRWVPMNHTKITSLYNPLSHKRVDIAQIKPLGLPRSNQDCVVELRQEVFFPVKGAMVAWMEAAIVGKSKIPFRKN